MKIKHKQDITMESKVATLKIMARTCSLAWKDVYDKVNREITKQYVVYTPNLFYEIYIQKKFRRLCLKMLIALQKSLLLSFLHISIFKFSHRRNSFSLEEEYLRAQSTLGKSSWSKIPLSPRVAP